jgi:hypothetical protein
MPTKGPFAEEPFVVCCLLFVVCADISLCF